MPTTLSRVLIATALLGAGAAAADARRVVVLEFDGPRTLADSGHAAVVRALGSEHDLIAPQRWLDTKAELARTQHGPKLWSKAAKQAGVDAIVEGWVQDEHRQRILTVVVSDASNGHELDHLTVKLGKDGITEATLQALRTQLADRLDALAPPAPAEPLKLGTTAPVLGPQPAPVAVAATTSVATAPTTITLEPKRLDWVPEGPKHVSHVTPRVRIAGGVGFSSRSLTIGAETDNVQQYAGVGAKQLGVDAAIYPFPRQRHDGQLSGVGFSLGVSQSLGSHVVYPGEDAIEEYAIDQHAWNAAVHYRAPLGSLVAIDGEVGYGRQTYNLDDASPDFEVPNTSYHALHVGTHVDLAITERATVGFGGKYFHVLDSGDLSSQDWYGPGSTSGLALDGNVVIPLPANLYVRGELSYTRFTTSFDGTGQITEDEGVYEAVDSNVGGTVKLGIQF